MRYDKISAANTKQGFARKDPAEKGHQQEHGGRNNPKRPAYDRFEDSGFLVPNNHGHSSVFQEVQGTHHRGGGGISSQHVTPMKPGGLYQDPTMNQSQKSNQTMRSGIIKDRPGQDRGSGRDTHMDGASAGNSNKEGTSGPGGNGGLGGFLGGLSGPSQVAHLQNGTFQI